ncbi:MAG: hypothetical protein HQL50_11655, partial [Magnetococcales bacterium]|nr:hypothetical protein [Magnetococcales bacterium]
MATIALELLDSHGNGACYPLRLEREKGAAFNHTRLLSALINNDDAALHCPDAMVAETLRSLFTTPSLTLNRPPDLLFAGHSLAEKGLTGAPLQHALAPSHPPAPSAAHTPSSPPPLTLEIGRLDDAPVSPVVAGALQARNQRIYGRHTESLSSAIDTLLDLAKRPIADKYGDAIDTIAPLVGGFSSRMDARGQWRLLHRA